MHTLYLKLFKRVITVGNIVEFEQENKTMNSLIKDVESYLYKCRYSNKEGITSYFYFECTIEPIYETMDILLGISRLITNKYYEGEHIQGEMKVVFKNNIDGYKNESIFVLAYGVSNLKETKDEAIKFESINYTASSYVAIGKLLSESRILQNDNGCPFISDNELIELFLKNNIHVRKLNQGK